MMHQKFKEIFTFLGTYVVRPVLVLFFTAYHAVLVLAAPAICVKLGLETNPEWRRAAGVVLGALFPGDPSALGVLWIIVSFSALALYAVALGVLAFQLPQALLKWNLVRLVEVLHGKWTDSLAYLAMSFGPVAYFAITVSFTGRVDRATLLDTMIIAVISQFGVLPWVAMRASSRETASAWRAASGQVRARWRVLLMGLVVPALMLPLFALALLTGLTALRLSIGPRQLVIFYGSLTAALSGSIEFYRHHFDEIFELMFTEDEDASD